MNNMSGGAIQPIMMKTMKSRIILRSIDATAQRFDYLFD